jgi:hypothetical protein
MSAIPPASSAHLNLVREIAQQYDANHDGVLVGQERDAFLVTLVARLRAGGAAAASNAAGVSQVSGTGATATGDQIDVSQVKWLHADVSGWKQTSTVTDVDISSKSVSIEHTKAGKWPHFGGAEGNPWVFVNRGGRWYAATYEWLRPGQTKKYVTAADIGAHTKREPIESWQPQPGELVGFMVSTPARTGGRTVNERSNVVLTRWPGAAITSTAIRSATPASVTASAPETPAVSDSASSVASSVSGVHKTDFLTMRGADGQRIFTGGYAGWDADGRARIRAALKERGYTHIYLNALFDSNGEPGRRQAFDAFEQPAQFREYLRELKADGLTPVVMLGVEDQPGNQEKYPPAVFQEKLRTLIPQIDDAAGNYLLGVETNEYWNDAELDQIGSTLNSLTSKPIYVHFTSGEWKGALKSWVSGLVYQYGFGLTEQQVEDRTRDLVARMQQAGKTFIAGEYAYKTDEATARRLGDAALRGGAQGFANGA